MRAPAGWVRGTLGDVIELQRGYDLPAPTRTAGPFNVIGSGGPNGTHHKPSTSGPGVVIGRSGAGYGRAWWSEDDFWALNTGLFVANFRHNNPKYVYYLLDFLDFTKFNSGGAQPSLNRNYIYPIPVDLPPRPEQRKIADILCAWDDAIDCTEALVTRLRGEHRLLLQGLIARHAHGGHVALGELVEPVKTKNTVGETNVLTSSARDGLVSQTEYFNKSVAGKNLSAYYLLHRGDFAYNRSSSAGHPFGAIRRLDRYDRGVISILYLCFRLRSDAAMSGTFLQNIFNSGVLDRQLSPICHEGARSHGLLNIAQSDFFELIVPLPSRDAQAIANKAIAASSREVELLQRKAEILRTQKRGLMQKLLTGQLRVDVAADIEPRGQSNND